MERPEIRLTAADPHDTKPEPGDPSGLAEVPLFCIALMDDFSGRGSRGREPGEASWRPFRLTPETVLGLCDLRPSIEIAGLGPDGDPAVFAFESMEDFGPDRLFQTHSSFEDLRQMRSAALSGELAPPAEQETPGAGTGGAPDAESPRESPAGLLDEILAATPGAGDEGPASPDDDLQEFVRDAVRPHVVRPAPDRTADVAAVDRAIGERMRRVLHDPAFRRLERAWRSAAFLLSRADSTGDLRVYGVDVTRADLETDATRRDGAGSRLHQVLREPDLGPRPARWGLVVGGASVDSPDDVGLIEHLGSAARAADVPWVVSGDVSLVGVEVGSGDPVSEDEPVETEGWGRIRDTTGSGWMMVAGPEFLLREPYGAETGRRIRAFEFEEESEIDEAGGTTNRPLLWGGAEIACAAVLASALAGHPELDLLGVPIAPAGPETGDPPVLTRTRLSRTGASRVITSGMVPVLAFPHEARLRLGGLRSIGRGDAPLRAWWSG